MITALDETQTGRDESRVLHARRMLDVEERTYSPDDALELMSVNPITEMRSL